MLIDPQGELCRVEAGVADVDVWLCPAAWAKHEVDPATNLYASHFVAAVEYGDDLLEGSFCELVEPIRESLRRQSSMPSPGFPRSRLGRARSARLWLHWGVAGNSWW